MEKSKRREIANRVNIWIMTITGIALVISAIATHDQEPMALHIVMAVLFSAACLRHIITHRKGLMKHLVGK